jgi:hypothetical protein
VLDNHTASPLFPDSQRRSCDVLPVIRARIPYFVGLVFPIFDVNPIRISDGEETGINVGTMV